ncbi:uncharacterized protein HHUB_3628 [Halobacterium hubeiense]|uniref:Nucleoside recognition protein n=1 Tax=Halobacterium hubeiense TaxID=1407499 RepID=A0A0U5D148_9EURY|nr:hypothetical protein [Halobacterium hubeiense]CQH62053.1 uncharacterized protein HHUB_3628 [Halobacterium hubeiense]
MQLAALLGDVLPRVAAVSLAIAVGLTLANLAVAFGAVEYVARFAKPLTGPANLPDEVGTAILATTASPTAGYGMLKEYRDAGVLDDRATLIAVTINTFFGFVQHIFTFYAPVLIPILGLEVGLTYVGARAGVSLAITLVGVLAGALFLTERNVAPATGADVDLPGDGDQTRSEAVRDALAKTRRKLFSIVPRLAVVYTAVVYLTTAYDVTEYTAAAAPLTELIGLPSASVPAIATFAVDTTTGAIFIAPQVPGTFTAREAVATMLVGGVVSFAVSTFKRSIPFQYGIWGARFGSKVIAVNVATKVVFIAVAIAVLLA